MFDTTDSPITIGRNTTNTISLDDSFLSKNQCAFIYDKVYCVWKIIDGTESKRSTHGTWLLIDSKYEITGTTLVKISNSVFKINFASGSV